MLKLDPKNTELLKQKQDILNSSIEITEDKLKQLKEIKAETDKKMAEGTEINEENYRALQREIIKTQNKLNDLKTENSKWNKAGTYLDNLGEELDSISTKIDKTANKLTTKLTAPIAALTTLGITYNAQLEKYTTAFTTFLGDADEAAKVVEQIKNDASKTPFDVTSLVQANQMLISTGENAEDSRQTILALGDAVTATGGGNDELTRMAANLQQIKNAGQATALDIKQFAYAGIDIYGMLADYTGKTTAKVKDMTISYEDLTGALKKANQQGGKYYNAMSNASETLTGQTNQLKAEFKDMTGDLTKSLMPTAKKLVAKAKDLIEKFDSLSDSQKENIINIGLMVAAAGPLLKVGSTAISTIGKVSSGLGTMTKAIGVASGKMTSTEDSVNSLAKVFKATFSPTGIAVVGITALAEAIIYLNTHLTEEQKEIKETSEAIKQQRDAYIESQQIREEALQSSISEIDNVQKLRNELANLVDENGKVRDGYESRVDFILTELNDALGTEYKLNDGIITQYDKLEESIDKVIAKKRAEAILTNEEEAWKQALENIDIYKETLANLNMTEQDYINKKAKIETLKQEMQKKSAFASTGSALVIIANYKKEIEALENQVSSYEEAKQNISDSYTAIENYEKNYALYTEGTADSIKQINSSVISSYSNLSNATAEELKKQLQISMTNLNLLKERYKENQNEITLSYLKEEEERTNSIVKHLVEQTSVIEENSPEIIDAWKQLATDSYSVYYDKVSQLPEGLSEKIQEMTGVTVERTPELVEETKNMANQVLTEIENNTEFRKKAIESLEGYLDGLEDTELREMLKEAGMDNVEEVIKGIREGNLSEDEGEKILSGLQKGLESTSWREKLWSTARGIASTLSGLLTVKANVDGKTSTLPGHKSGLDYVPYNNYVARLHKGERVLTAEENKQLMQMEKASKLKVPNMKLIGNLVADSTKTIFTTPNIIFNVQKMDEANLNSAFNYINRRLGSQY